MGKRAYEQFCGVARALELVGERWSLLIVRDLLVSPKRYTDLRRGLPRIPSNILAKRLRELERAGIVRRVVLPRPDGSIVYQLTDYGGDLEPVVRALGRWGARSLGEPRTGEIVTPDSLVTALRTTFRPAAASGLRIGYELRVGEIVVHARVEDGRLQAAPGGMADPDLAIETGPTLPAIMAGEISPTDAVERGDVRLTGDPGLLSRFVAIFPIERPGSAARVP